MMNLRRGTVFFGMDQGSDFEGEFRARRIRVRGIGVCKSPRQAAILVFRTLTGRPFNDLVVVIIVAPFHPASLSTVLTGLRCPRVGHDRNTRNLCRKLSSPAYAQASIDSTPGRRWCWQGRFRYVSYTAYKVFRLEMRWLGTRGRSIRWDVGAGAGAGTGADTAFAAFCLATVNFLNATNCCAASTALSASAIGLSAD
jgi:hypothetical protein